MEDQSRGLAEPGEMGPIRVGGGRDADAYVNQESPLDRSRIERQILFENKSAQNGDRRDRETVGLEQSEQPASGQTGVSGSSFL